MLEELFILLKDKCKDVYIGEVILVYSKIC